MASKQVLFRSEAREKVLRGSATLADAVRVTLGPKSKCVLIQKRFGLAARKEYVDLVEAGIIDPTKVVRIALENAVSAASLLLLTEATLTEAEEEKDKVPAPALG